MISRIKKDKWLHLIAGIYIYLIFNFIGEFIHPTEWKEWHAMAIVFIIAISKELFYDKLFSKGYPEVMDAVFTIVGGFSVMLLAM